MKASWVTYALITVAAFKAHSALALSRFLAEAVLLIASREANWFCAVLALPAGIADDFSTFSTGEMTECIISGPAEHRASLAIVVLITHKAVGVLELGSTYAVQVLGPVLTHSQVPLCGHGTDDALWVFCCQILFGISMHCFDDKRKGSRPRETEIHPDGIGERAIR